MKLLIRLMFVYHGIVPPKKHTIAGLSAAMCCEFSAEIMAMLQANQVATPVTIGFLKEVTFSAYFFVTPTHVDTDSKRSTDVDTCIDTSIIDDVI